MADNNSTKLSPRMLAFMAVVMFLFGGTAGYIVRDVRADVQVLRAANTARDNAQSLASEVLQRGQLAAGTLGSGMRVAAESTAAAVDRLTEKTDPAGRADSAKQHTSQQSSSQPRESEKSAADDQPTGTKH